MIWSGPNAGIWFSCFSSRKPYLSDERGLRIIRAIHQGDPQPKSLGASRRPPSVKPSMTWHLPHSF